MNKEVITYAGAATGALLLGKYAHKNSKPKMMVALYGVAGIALGAGIAELIMLKTGYKKNEGWMDLVAPIYIIGGIGILGVSEIAYRLLR